MSLENAIEEVKKELNNMDTSNYSDISDKSNSQLVISLDAIHEKLCQFVPSIQSLLHGISTYIEKYKES